MRSAVLSLIVCLSLSACESMPAMDEINFSQLNPFSEKAPVKQVEFKETTQTASTDQDALQTELQEIEMLTGRKPVIVRQGGNESSPTEVADNNIEAIRENIDPVFERPVIDQDEVAFNKGDQAGSMVPSKKPHAKTKPTASTQQPSEYIEIAEAEAAPAAPQTDVKAQPTVDSISWNQASKTRTASSTAPSPAAPQPSLAETPKPAPSIASQPTQQAMPAQNSPVQSLAMVRNPNLPPEVKGCPSLQIMPSARSITNFNDGNIGGQMTSRASIQDVRGGCEAVEGGMEIDLDIIMKGTVANAGRFEGNRNLEAFITFPYFVSIITPSGAPLDKEIMATAFRFKPMVDDLDHAEKITQFIPMDDVSKADEYGVTVGFQLSRAQLEYNRAQTMMRTNDKRVSPDTSTARKKSYNPLADE